MKFLKQFGFVLLSIVSVLFVQVSFAQTTNPGIFFQAVAKDNYSNPAKDRKIYVQSSILQATATGTAVLTEIHETTTDAAGVFSISIGQGTRTGGSATSLSAVPWAQGPFFLNLKIAITPTAPIANWDFSKDFIDLGTTPFGTVPYALYAGSVAGLDAKLNASDTTKMLSSFARVANLNSLVTNKVNVADSTTVYVTPAQLKAKTFDSSSIYNNIALKAPIASPTFTGTVSGITKAMVGLGNVDNTNDLNKPISTSAQAALDTKELLVNKSISISSDATSDTKYPSVKSVKSYVDAQITASTIEDADANTKGKLQLAGDLTGTAALPTIANNAITTNKIADANITDAKIATVSGSKVTGNIAGNASTATKLAATKNINGVAFDGSRDITITADANTLSNTTLASNVVNSNLTSVGTITSGVWSGTAVDIAHGGTGLSNIGSTGQVLTSTSVGTLSWTTPSIGVPYSGATGAVNLGAYDLTVNGLTLGLGRNAQSSNTAVGTSALSGNSAGIKNTGVGYQALWGNSNGSNNTGVGYQVLHDNANGNFITAVGDSALYKNYAGSYNTALGHAALSKTFSTSNNTGIGASSLYSSTGSDNTAIGYHSLYTNTSGSQNTALGVGADVSTGALSNTTAIGYGAIVNTSNTIQLGNASVTRVRTNGSITTGAVTYPNTDGITGQVLTTNGSGILSWVNASGGVTSIGNIDASSNSKGATVNSGVLSLTPADATNGGVVTNGTQTIGGDKTFNGSISAAAAILNAEITSSFTIDATNASQYNGNILICNPTSAINITIDNSTSIPTGFNFMVVQKSASLNRINFNAGTSATIVNRSGNTATAGQYAIATVVHIGNGVFVTSGDMQ